MVPVESDPTCWGHRASGVAILQQKETSHLAKNRMVFFALFSFAGLACSTAWQDGLLRGVKARKGKKCVTDWLQLRNSKMQYNLPRLEDITGRDQFA